MENKTEKVLLLTLGTGAMLKDKDGEPKVEDLSYEERLKRIRGMIRKKEFNYYKTIYQLPDKTIMEEKTEFVAERLAELIHPDRVMIIGTVRSCWTLFYTKFALGQVREDVFSRTIEELYEIEGKVDNDKNYIYGIETGQEELKKLSEKITGIYNRDLNNIFPNIKVVLIRYGIDHEEIDDNYKILTEIWEDIDPKKRYELSIDITHSFRSLPIYNLVIMDYYRLVGSLDITLKHVYYGNMDASYEYIVDGQKISPIVDLESILHIQELTRGVSEFKNTGSVKLLLDTISDSDLKQTLKQFDVATQTNNPNGIVDSIADMLKIKAEKKEKDDQTLLIKMFQKVLKDDLLEGADIEEYRGKRLTPQNFADFQFKLTRWYRSQNRYGLMSVMMLETARSYLVIPWLEKKKNGEELTVEDVKDKDKRENSIAYLDNLGERNTSEIEEFLKSFTKDYHECREIRNTFSHCRYEDVREQSEDVKKLNQFFEKLTELRKQIGTDEFRKVYQKGIKVKNDKIWIVISMEYRDTIKYHPLVKKEKTKRIIFLPVFLQDEIKAANSKAEMIYNKSQRMDGEVEGIDESDMIHFKKIAKGLSDIKKRCFENLDFSIAYEGFQEENVAIFQYYLKQYFGNSTDGNVIKRDGNDEKPELCGISVKLINKDLLGNLQVEDNYNPHLEFKRLFYNSDLKKIEES